MRNNFAFTRPHRTALELSQAATPIARKTHGKPFVSVWGGAMPASALIDAGAILALLDRTDRWHRICVDAFAQLRLPLLTSEAVLTELFHLVGDIRQEMEAAWRLVRSGAIVLAAIEDSELPDIRALMARYGDRPMDFADATLVYLAKREALATVFTVDHADFETYRIDGRRRFRVLPAGRP
jgi:uncharacterized protein